ncbi:MFS transporter [Actinoplanes sp. NPDC026623]|uniref:MFS transporter n=1 Tax=Actinoplanes sp. NPDC026623 TaxID=3155610 RepID=UPI0033D19E53
MPLVAVCAVWGVFWGVWGGLLPAVQRQIGGSLADLGLALVAIPIGAIPAMIFAGRLARGRERPVLATVVAAFAMTVAALAVPATPGRLAVTLAAAGMASGALDVCLNMAVARAERTSGRRLFQKVHAAFPIAVVACAPLTGVARQAGVSPAVILIATALVVMGVGVTAALRLPRTDHAPPGTQAPRPRAAATGARTSGRWFWLGILGACILVVENGVEQWSAVLLEDFRDAPPAVASSAPAVYYLALTAGRLIIQSLPSVSLRRVVSVGAGVGGLAMAFAATMPAAVPALACFALTGLAFGPLMPAMLAYAAGHDPDGALVARVTTASYSGFVVSPLLVSLLHRWLALPAALACLALFTLPLLAAAAVRQFAPPRDTRASHESREP